MVVAESPDMESVQVTCLFSNPNSNHLATLHVTNGTKAHRRKQLSQDASTSELVTVEHVCMESIGVAVCLFAHSLSLERGLLFQQ